MGTFLKLAIAGLILNAVVHAGMAYLRFYQFKDDAEQVIRFGATQSASMLQTQLFDKAAALAIPVGPDDVGVQRQGTLTYATADYTDPVELFPRYRYPLKMSFRVEAFSVVGAAPSGR